MPPVLSPRRGSVGHVMATVRELLGGEPSFVSMFLYWTLFLGVLAFWSSDESPHRQDSLAFLDQSLRHQR